MEEAEGMDDAEGVTVDKDGKGVPLYSRKSRISWVISEGRVGMIGIE